MFYAANNKLSVKHCSTRYPIRLICSSDSQNVHHIYAIINTVRNVCLQFGSWRNTINCLKCAQYWETMEIQLISTMVLIHLNNKSNDLFYVKNQLSIGSCKNLWSVPGCHIKYQQVHHVHSPQTAEWCRNSQS